MAFWVFSWRFCRDLVNGGTLDWGGFAVFRSTVSMWLDCCRDVGAPRGVYKTVNANATIRNHTGTGEISAGVVILPDTNSGIYVTPE